MEALLVTHTIFSHVPLPVQYRPRLDNGQGCWFAVPYIVF